MFNPLVKMDEAHYRLIEGHVYAQKPEHVLEFGFGSGELTERILTALDYNDKGSLTVVENWYDWNYERQPLIQHKRLTYVEKSEEQFVSTMSGNYDMIIADGDHYNTHRWFMTLINNVRFDGAVFFHDVTNSSFPNLQTIYFQVADHRRLGYKLFNTSSRLDERCERGLLAVWRMA